MKPGYKWRLQAHRKDGTPVRSENDGLFDELAIDDWFHLEQLDDRCYWMQIGDARITVHIPAKGPPQVNIQRGEYGDVCGRTEVTPCLLKCAKSMNTRG